MPGRPGEPPPSLSPVFPPLWLCPWQFPFPLRSPTQRMLPLWWLPLTLKVKSDFCSPNILCFCITFFFCISYLVLYVLYVCFTSGILWTTRAQKVHTLKFFLWCLAKCFLYNWPSVTTFALLTSTVSSTSVRSRVPDVCLPFSAFRA